MKKLLTILGSLGMAATGSTALVSCGTTTKAEDSIGNQIRELEYQKEELVEQIRIANEELADLNKTYSLALGGLQKQDSEIKTEVYLLEHVDPSRAMLAAKEEVLETIEELLEEICKLQKIKDPIVQKIKALDFELKGLDEKKKPLIKQTDELNTKIENMNKLYKSETDQEKSSALLNEIINLQDEILKIQRQYQTLQSETLNIKMVKSKISLELTMINRSILEYCFVNKERVIGNPNNCFIELKAVKQARKENKKSIEDIDYFREHRMSSEWARIDDLKVNYKKGENSVAENVSLIEAKREIFNLLQDKLTKLNDQITSLKDKQKSYQ